MTEHIDLVLEELDDIEVQTLSTSQKLYDYFFCRFDEIVKKRDDVK